MYPSESPFIHFIRSVTLLSILTAVPGIAIFWNHLPGSTVNRPASVESDVTPTYAQDFFAFLEPPIQQAVREQPQSTSEQEVALLKNRLQVLGATHQQLQPWGSSGELYRFVCHVTLPGTSFTMPFDATGPDPVAVIQSVIADVEQWRLGR